MLKQRSRLTIHNSHACHSYNNNLHVNMSPIATAIKKYNSRHLLLYCGLPTQSQFRQANRVNENAVADMEYCGFEKFLQ